MIDITLTRDIATCRRLRRTVFIEEQGVSEADEVDDKDDAALHLLATEQGRAVGTARIIVSGDTGKIGRVCVLADQRGKGIGALLIRQAIAVLRQNPAIKTAKLGAQTHALAFYENLGFTAYGPLFDDAGIEHQNMALPL
jgi:predicted GNAT family N-acyltransferase